MITRNWDFDYFEADDMLESATFSLQNLKNYYFWLLLVDDDLGMKTEWGCRRHIRHSNLDRELDNCKYSEASWVRLVFHLGGKEQSPHKTNFVFFNRSSYTQYFSWFWFLLRKINNTSPHLDFTFIWNNSQLTAVCCRMKAAYVYLQQIGVLSSMVLGALRVFEFSSKYFWR